MGLSLKELKEYLVAKQGYTITPNHSQLMDLKLLVDDMMSVRSESSPGTGSGYNSGTKCIGHQVVTDYKVSLGDIKSLNIKSCSCHQVNDTTAYCDSRTYTCSCNSNIPLCDCNLRTGSCSCNSNTPLCNCNARTAIYCDCQSRWAEGACECDSDHCGDEGCTCDGRQRGCSCRSRTASDICNCYSRTADYCDCQSRIYSCGTVSPSECTCVSRTSACGSRDTISCTCNGRCACNSEKRFE